MQDRHTEAAAVRQAVQATLQAQPEATAPEATSAEVQAEAAAAAIAVAAPEAVDHHQEEDSET